MARSYWGLLLVYGTAGLLVVYPSVQASASPGDGNCSDCHGTVPVLSTTPANGGKLSFGATGYTLVGQSSTAVFTVADTSTASKGAGFSGSFPAASGKFSPTTTQALTTQYGGYLVGPGVKSNGHPEAITSVSRTYTYKPTIRGKDTLNITFTPTNGFTGTPPSSTITLSGQGVAPVISLDTATANAGNVRIGTTGAASLKVTNVGDGNLAGAGLGNLTGTVAAGASGFTGTGGAFNLADNGNQTFNYTFSPTTHGAASTTVAVNSTNGSTDGTNKAQALSGILSGTGVGPTLSTSIVPNTTIDFGQIACPQSAFRTLTVSNLTTDLDLGALTNLGLISATITGPNAAMFSLPSFTPGAVLTKSQLLDLQLAFAPTVGALGTETALLTLLTDEGAASGASGKSIAFPLTGVALPPPSLPTAYWKGSRDGNWSTTSPGYNWTTAADGATETTALPGTGTDVYFVASSPGTLSTTLGTNFSIKSLNFTATATSPVTIAGPNTLTIANGVSVASGSANHTISANVQLAASQTWSVNGAAKLTAAGPISGTGSAGLTKDGSGTLVLSAANTYSGGTNVKAGTLQVAHADALPVGRDFSMAGAGTATTLASGLTSAVKVGALSIDGGGTPVSTLDLANNALIVNKSSTPASTIGNLVRAAYAGGAWTGPGITSSLAAADFATNGAKAGTAVGYADNADFGLGLTSFGGRAVDGNSVLIRYTLFGDANLDGNVDATDLGLMQHSFGMTTGATWDEGDFNYDGKVNLNDAMILRAHYLQSLPAGSPAAQQSVVAPPNAVPEPGTVELIVAAGLALGGIVLCRHGRRARVRSDHV